MVSPFLVFHTPVVVSTKRFSQYGLGTDPHVDLSGKARPDILWRMVRWLPRLQGWWSSNALVLVLIHISRKISCRLVRLAQAGGIRPSLDIQILRPLSIFLAYLTVLGRTICRHGPSIF